MSDTIAAASVLPEFRVGKVLGQTFSIFFNNFLAFFGIAVAFYAPAALFDYFFYDPQEITVLAKSDGVRGIWGQVLVSLGLNLVVMAMIQTALLYGAIEYQAGRRVGLSVMLQTVLRALVPVIIAALLVSILSILGMLFLLIPGIIILVMMSMTTPAIVVEKLGPIAAMKRSSALTSGYKWPVFGVFLVLVVLLYAVMIGVGLVMGLGLDEIVMQDEQTMTLSLWQLLSSGAYYALIGSCVVAVYTNLRAAKEGATADEVADVFA